MNKNCDKILNDTNESMQTDGIYVKKLDKTVLSTKQLEHISKVYGRDIYDILMSNVNISNYSGFRYIKITTRIS